MNLPIKGMTKTPAYLAIDNGAAFVSCMFWALGVPEMRAQFKVDTGLDVNSLAGRHPLEMMIDQATGYEAKLAGAFADWVCVNVWGEEGQQAEATE